MSDGDNPVISMLTHARDLISGGWCQGTFARNKKGTEVSFTNDNACRYCSSGALNRSYFYSSGSHADWQNACSSLRKAIGEDIIYKWNDAPARTQNEIVAAFDAAIAWVKSNA